METNYEFRKKIFLPLKLWLLLIAFVGMAFVTSAQPTMTPTGNQYICPGTGMDIGVLGATLGNHYQVYRNGNPYGMVVQAVNTTFENLGTFYDAGTYQVWETETAVFIGAPDQMVLAFSPVFPANVVPVSGVFNICGYNTSQPYTIGNGTTWVLIQGNVLATPPIPDTLIHDPDATPGTGDEDTVLVRQYTWTTWGKDTACAVVNLSLTGQGTNQVTVWWGDSQIGEVFCDIKTVDECVFRTMEYDVFVWPYANKQHFTNGANNFDLDTIHYCSNDVGIDICLNSQFVEFIHCVTGDTIVLGYKYILRRNFTPVDTVFGTGSEICFTNVVTDPFDTAMYTVYAIPWDETINCIKNMGDTIILIRDFAPIADAGPDQETCAVYGAPECFTVYGHTGVPYSFRDASFAYNWTYTNPDGIQSDLIFTPGMTDSTVNVCQDYTPGGCPFGIFEIVFHVVNGPCTDSDTAYLKFIEEPTADAGADDSYCDVSAFNLAAIPYVYCGVYGVNRWDTAYWEVYVQPVNGVAAIVDVNDPNTVVNLSGSCIYGVYTFVWHEENSGSVSCTATDTVNITVYEQPVADAGTDFSACDESCNTLTAIPHTYCQTTGLDVSYEWSLFSGPASVTISNPAAVSTGFCIATVACPWGEFVFQFVEANGDCSDTAYVMYTNYEPPVNMSAGTDTQACETDCVTLVATGHSYCQPSGQDVSYLWEAIPGSCDWIAQGPVDQLTVEFCIDTLSCTCPYGMFGFVFTETNGDCVKSDTVYYTRYEQPWADAGPDQWACVDNPVSAYTMYLNATPYPYCYTVYDYWTKAGGPGHVWFENFIDPQTGVNVDAFGCYSFIKHEVNPECEAHDTVMVAWIEQPQAIITEIVDTADCGSLACADLGDLGVVKYVYAAPPSVNFDNAHWELVSGPDTANFADPTDPNTDMCVATYGAYEIMWIEMNGPACDMTWYCSDTAFATVYFFEDPAYPDAGPDDEICGTCYDLSATPYQYLPPPSQLAANATMYWEADPTNPCTVSFADSSLAATQVCFDLGDCLPCYGTYNFIFHQINGNCHETDTVAITFHNMPDAIPIATDDDGTNDCGMMRATTTLWPNDIMEVCADACMDFYVPAGFYFDDCQTQFPYLNPDWVYQWSVIGPAGTTFEAQAGYNNGNGWVYPELSVCWGECCDTAIIYLNISSPECDTTLAYYFYVNHLPDAEIQGPEIAEVSTIFYYTTAFDSCYLYNWQVEHCGVITSGQGTNTIGVHWLVLENNGIGEIVLNVEDTCTGCCNIGQLDVTVLPQGSLGSDTLSGHVTYDNTSMTPLNGVDVTLWNAGVAVFTATTFNDVGGNGAGYYEFAGINGATTFDVTAAYGAPWFGANATDALAVELNVIGQYPIVWDNLNTEAGDVNASGGLSATDALWIKQRAIAMVNAFPAGDWAFDPAMSSAGGVYDFMSLNYGDVTRSNVPSGVKEVPAIDLVVDGTIYVEAGKVFELPIRVADAIELGAVTLNLGFNSELLEVVDVSSFEGMINSINDNNIMVAWASTNTMSMFDNDAVITVKVKALGEIATSDQLFSIGLGSEFADGNANVINEVTLKTFGVSTDIAPIDYALGNNRPNPFTHNTEIEYSLPETGKVRLTVINILGSEIATLVEATQSAGTYTVMFSSAGLTPGVYLYKLIVDGESKDFVETRRMVISH